MMNKIRPQICSTTFPQQLYQIQGEP